MLYIHNCIINLKVALKFLSCHNCAIDLNFQLNFVEPDKMCFHLTNGKGWVQD